MVFVLERTGETWKPRSPVRITVVNGLIADITDYFFCPWMLEGRAPPS